MRQVSIVSSEEQSVRDFSEVSKNRQNKDIFFFFYFLIRMVQCSRQVQLFECGDFLLPLHSQKFVSFGGPCI